MKFKLNFLLSQQNSNKAYHIGIIIATLYGYSCLTIIVTDNFSKLDLKHHENYQVVHLTSKKKNLFEATFVGQRRKSEWESSFFKKYCYWTP